MQLGALVLAWGIFSGSAFTPKIQTASVCYNLNLGSENAFSNHAFQGNYRYESEMLCFGAGIMATRNQFDFTTDVEFFPLQFGIGKAGPFFLFHEKTVPSDFNEYDFLAGGEFELDPVNWFTLRVRAAYMGMVNDIIPLRPYSTNPLCNQTFYLDCKCLFRPWKYIDLYAEASNCEYFRYNIFSSASFITGARFYTDFGLTGGIEVSSRWIDLLSNAARYDGTDLKFWVGYCW